MSELTLREAKRLAALERRVPEPKKGITLPHGWKRDLHADPVTGEWFECGTMKPERCAGWDHVEVIPAPAPEPKRITLHSYDYEDCEDWAVCRVGGTDQRKHIEVIPAAERDKAEAKLSEAERIAKDNWRHWEAATHALAMKNATLARVEALVKKYRSYPNNTAVFTIFLNLIERALAPPAKGEKS